MTRVFENLNDFIRERKNITTNHGFVPSLGGLHSGHISLIKKSLNENDKTTVSIFLNPTQFNDPKDLDNYPSTWADDLKILKELKVDHILKPTLSQIYPDDYSYIINEKKISKDLCGAVRPGHFTGVLTIVMKLLNIVKADRAYFGEKDYQQLLLIKNMVSAFFLGTEIIACPIIREKNGLALSSRNRLLNQEQKKIAPLLFKTINKGISVEQMYKELSQLGFRVDYLEKKWGRIFVAAFLGQVRLIDNVVI